MKKKLILYNLIVTVVVLLLMFGLGIAVTNSNYTEISEKKIKEITAVYIANYAPDMQFPNSGDVRVTVIDGTGKVLADSLQTSEENHLYREEIEAAAKGKPKVVVRRSETLNRDMMYYAEKKELEEGSVFVRVAIPIESVNSYALKSAAPMFVILLGVLLCSAVASVLLSGVFLKPLKEVKEGLAKIGNGTYEPVTPATGDADLNAILSSINDLSERLQDTMLTAEREKSKLRYVLSNVSDGIAVFDEAGNVAVANESLKQIFGVTEPEGQCAEVLTADRTFSQAIADCAEKKTGTMFEFTREGKVYQCTVRYTDSGMIIAVLSDMTEAKKSEQMRLEFFANASHELKTPLTAIKGFNDMVLITSKDETVLDYSTRISKEVDRVVNLLGDMLDLSKLENSKPDLAALGTVDLREVADEVKESLKPLSEPKKVRVEVRGEGEVKAEREHVYELIKNLAENGVRYNNEGGKVEISLSKEKDGIKLTVSDDGIGVGAEHRGRIFERFYRVDKSRSRRAGGTGLGLAIVKHICELYGAELSFKSKLGVGTTVTVIFHH